MSLTGPGLLLVMSLMTLAVFIGAVVGFPLISGRRWAALTVRSLVLVVLNVSVLLTAGIAFNDKYQFYADWTDLGNSLFGTGAGPLTSLNAGGSAASAAGANPFNYRPTGTPVGAAASTQILTYEVSGPRSGLSGIVMVSLPPGYSNSANAHRHYPVIETFPGYPGGPRQWYTGMNLVGALYKTERAHELAPVITISPQTEFPGGIDTECVNGPGRYPKVETWLTQDVPSWAERAFRVSSGRQSWATLGFSAGAWCAAMAPMLHPAQYAAGMVMGGYFHPEFSSTYRPFGPQSSQARRYNLIALARNAPPPVALWIETSHADRLSYRSSTRLLAAARAPLSIHAVELLHAGHRIPVWIPLVPKALTWLGTNISGFRPQSQAGQLAVTVHP